jgi:hypothetical protein
METSNKSAALCIGELSGLHGQLGEKYFDYSADYIHIDHFQKFDYLFTVICVDSVRFNFIAPLRVSVVPCHAQVLAATHSRKTIGNVWGPDINSPRSAKITLKTTSLTSATRRSQQRSGARQQLRL